MSFAAEATFDFSTQGYANQTAVNTVTVNEDVTITFAGGGNSNTPKYYTSGTAVRMYPKNSFTVTTTTGKLTKIVITFGSSDGTLSIASNVGSYASGTWTGEDASVILTVDPSATSGNRRIKAITVTYGEVADNYVAAPSISGDVNFIESTEVSIAAGEGLKVYYTLDGTEPTNTSTEYTAAFEVTETTTVKAIAYNGENASEVASQTFSKAIQVTCAEAKEIALALNDKATTELFYVVKGYVTSTVSDWKSGKQSFWIADTKDGGNVFEAYYCFISEAAVVGDYVQLFGQLKRFGSTAEMSDGQATIIPEPVVEPTTETVYYVNTKNWETVTAHAWEGNAAGTAWPGLPTAKEEEQIGGYDVYSFTANVGDYAMVIFNNNGKGDQTGNLEWTAGKYYVKDGWYTKEEAEAKLAQPAEYESVYLIDNQNWGNANIYTWQPDVKGWPGAAMTKEAEQLAGFDVYSYTVEKGTAFGGMLFNNGTVQTVDLTWTAGQYYLLEEQNAEGKWTGKWCTKEEALELLGGTPEEPTYEVFEEEITDLVVDVEAMTISGGPSANYMVKVILGLGDYDRNEGTYQLLPESYVSIQGTDATFVDGYVAELDAFTPSAKAVVRCVWNGMNVELHLNMSAAPMEATVVVVENATAKVEKYIIFGDEYEHSLKITGEWLNPEDGVTYPVLVEVPVYYPESTEPSEILSTVTVGGSGDNDPWFGFGEGTLTITTVGDVVTATGVVQNPMAGVAIDITITGKISTGHTVTIVTLPEGAGVVTGAGEYEDGAEVTVTAEENEGWYFMGWYDATTSILLAEDYEYTFQALGDVNLIAYFIPALEGMATDLVIGENTLTASTELSLGKLNMNLVLGEGAEGVYEITEESTLTIGDKAVTLMVGIAMVIPEDQMAVAIMIVEYNEELYYIEVLMVAPETGVDNITTTVAPAKVIKNGQLIIIKNGVEYNVQGAQL